MQITQIALVTSRAAFEDVRSKDLVQSGTALPGQSLTMWYAIEHEEQGRSFHTIPLGDSPASLSTS